nr:MAG TPA: hypothetical protein [Caudoviricetes sp.]
MYSVYDFLKDVITAIVVCMSMLIVGFAILSTVGCAKQCEKCNEKFVEVKVPVPQKCDFVLRPKPDINTSTMQGVYESITELALDGVELRKKLELVPCLNSIYEEKK